MALSDPGNMVLVEGEDRVKAWLLSSNRIVDDWLYEVVDEMIFYAYERIRQHAPGRIHELVDVIPAHETATGAFEGIAGVEPEIAEETFHRGLGSDPADFPVFVEVGTGIFGETGTPISTIPGHLMGPIFDPERGHNIFTSIVKGQPGQHYVRHSFEELVERTPVVLKASLLELGKRT